MSDSDSMGINSDDGDMARLTAVNLERAVRSTIHYTQRLMSAADVRVTERNDGKEGMCSFVQFNSRLNQLSLSHEYNKKKDEKNKTNKNDEQLSHEMVIKIHEICPKR